MGERAMLTLLDPRRKFKSEFENQLVQETVDPIIQGYARKNGVRPALRALLRIATDSNYRAVWQKDLEYLLEKEGDLTRKELKEKVANGVDIELLRSRGATEHELELAGVPVGKLDEQKMESENEYEEFLKNLILQQDKHKVDTKLKGVASALKELNTLTNYMNILVKDTTDYMDKTDQLIQNVGEAGKYAGNTRGQFNGGISTKQADLARIYPKENPNLTAPGMGAEGDSFADGRRLSNAFDQRRLSNAYEQRRLSNAYEQRRLSNAYEQRRLSNAFDQGGRRLSNANNPKISARQGSMMESGLMSMTQLNFGSPNQAVNNIRFAKLLLKAGAHCFFFSKSNPKKPPVEHILYREDEVLFWHDAKKNKRQGLGTVVGAVEGLPGWFADSYMNENPWVKERFMGRTYLEKCCLALSVQELKTKTAMELSLCFDTDDVAEKLAFYFNADVNDDSLTKIRQNHSKNAYKSRSRAKTLQNQSTTGNFINQEKDTKRERSKSLYTTTSTRKKVEKTKKEAEFLHKIMDKCPVFEGASQAMREEVIEVIRRTNIAAGMIVCQKGNFASNFYIVEEGTLEAFLTQTVEENSVVDITYNKDDYFGESSLIFKSPNLHHVIASCDSVIWALDQETFKKVVTQNIKLQKMLDTILEVSIFNALDDAMFANIILDFKRQDYAPDENIVELNSSADYFYVLQSGSVDLVGSWYGGGTNESRARVEKSMTLPGQFFGDYEICFDLPFPRAYKAGEKGASMLLLNKERFSQLIDFIIELSESNMKKQVLHSLPTFSTLDDFEVMDVIDSFTIEKFKKGELIISKGDIGDKFYFIKKGECVVMDKENGKLKMLTRVSGHASFGELALLSDEPRSAYVAADAAEVELYCLTRSEFRRLVDVANKAGSKSQVMGIITKIDLLNALSENDFNVLVDALTVENVSEGEKVIVSGTTNDKLFIVTKGELLLTREQDLSVERVRLLPGNYFGERALMTSEKCTYNVTATRVTELMTLSRHVFEQYCGSLADLLQNELKKSEEESRLTACGIDAFTDKGIIGRGAFGTVRLVQEKVSNKYYALKYLIKDNIVKKKQQRHLKQEISIMQMLDHAMIISLWKKWQDKKFIYLLTEICSGGELFIEIKKSKGFPEDRAKFYAACTASILIELRKKEVIFRDLKPENILISDDGYLKLIDFGFGKVLPNNKKTFSLCGTPDYVAPEILLNQGYNHAVDTWALGILVYEMIANETPFKSTGGAKGILKNILNKKLQFPKEKFSHVSKDCISFIQECLKKEPMLRIGYKDSRELKNHPWFQEYGKHGWNALERKLIRPPYVPNDVNPEKIPKKEPKEVDLTPPADVHDYEIDSIFADFDAVNELR